MESVKSMFHALRGKFRAPTTASFPKSADIQQTLKDTVRF